MRFGLPFEQPSTRAPRQPAGVHPLVELEALPPCSLHEFWKSVSGPLGFGVTLRPQASTAKAATDSTAIRPECFMRYVVDGDL